MSKQLMNFQVIAFFVLVFFVKAEVGTIQIEVRLPRGLQFWLHLSVEYYFKDQFFLLMRRFWLKGTFPLCLQSYSFDFGWFVLRWERKVTYSSSLRPAWGDFENNLVLFGVAFLAKFRFVILSFLSHDLIIQQEPYPHS